MLDAIKKALRISNNSHDSEINQMISACSAEMERVGIVVNDEDGEMLDNELIKTAIILWCKWQFDFNKKGEEFFKHYEMLRNAIMLSK